MSFEAIIAVVGIAVALITFGIQSWMNRKITKREIYQRLEFASIDLFRFEIQNSALAWRLFDEADSFPEPGSKEFWEIQEYVCQVLNLFEMAVEFRKDKIIPNNVFVSWIAWFWDVCNSAHFPELWKEVRLNYTSELQFIMNAGLQNKGNWDAFIAALYAHYGCKLIKQLSEESCQKKKQ